MSRRILLAATLLFGGCFSEPPASGVDDSETEGCEPATLGCECSADGSCSDGSVCNASILRCVSEECDPGELACPCDAGGCDAGLICTADMLCASDVGTSTTTNGGSGSAATSMPTSATTATTMESTTMSMTSGQSSSSDTSSGGEAGPVTIYFTNFADVFDWNGGARTQATGFCEQAAPDGAGCTQVVALISTNDSSISALGVPTNSLVVNASGQDVASTFQSFLDAGPDGGNSLEAVNVDHADQPGSRPESYGTGSSADGGLGATCLNWTSSSTADSATLGTSTAGGTQWASFTDYPCADGGGPVQSHALCACWSG